MPGPGRLQAVLPPVDPAQGRWRTPPSQRPRCPVGFAVGSPGQSTRKLNRGSTCPGTAEGAHVARAPGEGRALLCSSPPPSLAGPSEARPPPRSDIWGLTGGVPSVAPPGGRWRLIHRVSRLFLRGLRGPPELRSRSPPPARPLVRSARFHVLARGRGCFPEARYPSSSAEFPVGLTAPGTWVPGKCMPSE